MLSPALDGSLEPSNGISSNSLRISNIRYLPVHGARDSVISMKTIAYGSGVPESVKDGLKRSMKFRMARSKMLMP